MGRSATGGSNQASERSRRAGNDGPTVLVPTADGLPVSNHVRIELVDDEPRAATGATTDRLLFRVIQGGETKATVVTGIAYELLAQRNLDTPGRQLAYIKDHAPDVIRRKYEAGGLGDLHRVDSETVALDLTEHNVPPV